MTYTEQNGNDVLYLAVSGDTEWDDADTVWDDGATSWDDFTPEYTIQNGNDVIYT